MPGFTSVTGGQSVMYADNVCFDGTTRSTLVTSDGQLLIGSSSSPHLQPGNLTSTGATIAITNGPGTINLEVNEAGYNWNLVTSASPTNPIQIISANAYVCNGVSQVTFILPLAPNLGDSFLIISNTSTFQITENGAQQIRIGANISTAGSGNLTSNTVGDIVEISYIGSNLFISRSPQGTITLN